MFENHRKSLIQHCERSEFSLHFEWKKDAKKWSILATFEKPETCSLTVLPDRPTFTGQKLEENAKMAKIEWDIFGDF